MSPKENVIYVERDGDPIGVFYEYEDANEAVKDYLVKYGKISPKIAQEAIDNYETDDYMVYYHEVCLCGEGEPPAKQAGEPKYIWGLQPEDFAAAVISENDYVSENKVVYTEEISDDDLRAKLFNNHHGIFTIENWTEYVRYYAQERFTKEDWNVVETMKQRKLI